MSDIRSLVPGDTSMLTREPYTGTLSAEIAAAGIARTEVLVVDDPRLEAIELSVIVGDRYEQQLVPRSARDDSTFFAALVDSLAVKALWSRSA